MHVRRAIGLLMRWPNRPCHIQTFEKNARCGKIWQCVSKCPQEGNLESSTSQVHILEAMASSVFEAFRVATFCVKENGHENY